MDYKLLMYIVFHTVQKVNGKFIYERFELRNKNWDELCIEVLNPIIFGEESWVLLNIHIVL